MYWLISWAVQGRYWPRALFTSICLSSLFSSLVLATARTGRLSPWDKDSSPHSFTSSQQWDQKGKASSLALFQAVLQDFHTPTSLNPPFSDLSLGLRSRCPLDCSFELVPPEAHRNLRTMLEVAQLITSLSSHSEMQDEISKQAT